MTVLVHRHRASWSPTTRRNGDGDPLGIISDAALVVDGAPHRVGRPARDAPDADDRVDCAGTERDPGIRRQPRASGVRGRPVRRVRARG